MYVRIYLCIYTSIHASIHSCILAFMHPFHVENSAIVRYTPGPFHRMVEIVLGKCRVLARIFRLSNFCLKVTSLSINVT